VPVGGSALLLFPAVQVPTATGACRHPVLAGDVVLVRNGEVALAGSRRPARCDPLGRNDPEHGDHPTSWYRAIPRA